MSEWRLWQALAVLTAALYGGLAWLWFAELVPGAGGLTPYDARLFGYTPAEGEAYFLALSREARAVYLGDVRLLYTLFPFALATLLMWPLLRLPAGAWRVLAVLPLGYLAADLIENARVARILLWDVPEPEMYVAASRATVTKYALLIASTIALAAVFVATKRP